MNDVFAAFFFLLGGLASLIAAIGVLRLPDLFLRMHAAGMAGTVGLSSVVIGLVIHFGALSETVRGLLVILFFFATTPVAAHMIGRSAYRSGIVLWKKTCMDEYRRRRNCD